MVARKSKYPVSIYFVAHEFTKEKIDDLRGAIEHGLTGLELIPYYADAEVRHGSHILEKIWGRIIEAEFAIFDVSNPTKPNVFIELGIAIALKKRWYIICEEEVELPADIRGYDTIFYKSYKELAELIRDKILPQEMKWSSGRKHLGKLSVSELEKMKLEQQVRQGMPLAGIILDGADLQRAMLREVNFEKASLKGVNLYGADLWRANLQAANLESANLAGAGLWASFLDGANLQKTNLEKTMLDKARLRSTDLRGANLKAASLEKADLKDAKIQDANLEKTNLRRAYLGGVEGFEEVRSLSGTILIDVEGLTQEQIEFARSSGSKVSDY